MKRLISLLTILLLTTAAHADVDPIRLPPTRPAVESTAPAVQKAPATATDTTPAKRKATKRHSKSRHPKKHSEHKQGT